MRRPSSCQNQRQYRKEHWWQSDCGGCQKEAWIHRKELGRWWWKHEMGQGEWPILKARSAWSYEIRMMKKLVVEMQVKSYATLTIDDEKRPRHEKRHSREYSNIFNACNPLHLWLYSLTVSSSKERQKWYIAHDWHQLFVKTSRNGLRGD